ncbi:MAG: flagellar type III secretion system protein FliQ [Oscillospiraceae bacterium]|nr:flagellar type III secretion system protein FliQ [Oscillospiraceae bacterium]
MVVSSVLRDALTVAIKLSAPMLVLCMAIGIVVAIFQAVTQIHEQTLGFVLKLVIIITVLLIGGTWMLTTLQDYTKELFLIIGS